MRVALLSIIQPTSDASGVRGLLPIAGRNLALRQVELALRLKCERIICLSEGPGDGSLELQHRAEKEGARFHFAPHSRGLAGLVNADDELFVFAEGLFADPKLATELLDGGRAILTLPAEKGVPQGYERIDRDHAWAGILKTRGSAVEAISDMGRDVDPVSALLRTALQTGGTMRAVPKAAFDDGRWTLLWDAPAAETFESDYIRRNVSVAPFSAPFHALGDRIALALRKRAGSPGLRYGLPALAVLTLGGSLYLGWTVLTGWALVALAVAALLLRTGQTFAKLAGEAPEEGAKRGRSDTIITVMIDTAFLAIVATAFPRSLFGSAIFAAFVLLAGIRLVPRSGPVWAASAVQDRVSIAFLLAIGAFLGNFLPAIQWLAAIALLLLLIVPAKAKITQT